MQERKSALNNWLNHIYPEDAYQLTPLTGDASFRRYYRLVQNNMPHIVMDAPPQKEPVAPFIQIGNALRALGLHTPEIYQADEKNGFLLLEDFGDELFLDVLRASDKADYLYKEALKALIKLQQYPILDAHLPLFDQPFMMEQMHLFQHWFLEQYLNLELNQAEKDMLQDSFYQIAEEILKQPYVFTHCDYHSRNLMLISKTNPVEIGILDYQDAMIGPFTYDLVSLLKDCYIQWPRKQTLDWLSYFYNHLPSKQGWSLEAFIQGFDLCGIQRHLKVLGIFSRLHLRDKKSAYLNDLPLVLSYLMQALETVDLQKPFYQFLEQKVCPIFYKKFSL